MARLPVLLFRLLMDRRVPLRIKIIPLVAIIYALLPTDIIPDFLPILGWLDDAVVLIISAVVFLGLGSFSISTGKPTRDSKTQSGEVINGKYRVVVDDDDETIRH